jgi:hypothetical protein
MGITWKALINVTSVPFAGSAGIPRAFPTEWQGDDAKKTVMTIVKGWQLLIISFNTKEVWRFTSVLADMENLSPNVQLLISGELPFADRAKAQMFATSDNKVYLVGGNTCIDETCTNNQVRDDVWMSADVGETWVCMTSNIDPTIYTQYSMGLGSYSTATITGDDTIFLLGGLVANSTDGLNTIYMSQLAAPDTTFSATPYVIAPQTATAVYRDFGSIHVFFKEAIQKGSGTIKFGKGTALTATGASTTISGNSIKITPTPALVANTQYTLQMPLSSIKDLSGNTLASAPTYTFTVSSDVTVPKVSAGFPANLATGIASTTNFVLKFDERVQKGTGTVDLVPSVGNTVKFDIADGILRTTDDSSETTTKMFFAWKGAGVDSPSSSTYLTEGAKYTIKVPAGFVKDLAGNAIAATNPCMFTVLSGSQSWNDYAGGAGKGVGIETATVDWLENAEAPAGNKSLDSTEPKFASSFPKNGATDVPAGQDVKYIMYFDEPVKFNTTGVISILNQTSQVVAKANLTSDEGFAISPFLNNATAFVVPGSILVKGQNFRISIPTGVIKDVSGNALKAITKSFTCLSGTADTTAPERVMASQGEDAPDKPREKMELYFSEDIVRTSGSITVAAPGSAPAINTPITDANVSLIGTYGLRLSLYSGALDTEGTYKIQVPAGSLKDASGNHFKGLNLTANSLQYRPWTPRHRRLMPKHQLTRTLHQLMVFQSQPR